MRFLAGLGVGFVLGVLYAPQSGQHLRREVSEKVDEIAANVGEAVDNTRKRVRRAGKAGSGRAKRKRAA